MRPDEAFVCRSLVQFFGGPSEAVGSDGDDPPDLCLSLSTGPVGVEVTSLSQFTLKPGGRLGNRMTLDSFGLRVIEELDSKVGVSLPTELSLLIGIWVPVDRPSRYRSQLKSWVARLASTAQLGAKKERFIEGSNVRLSVIPRRPSGKAIVGFVVNKHSSADILLNARLALEDRIRTKDTRCRTLGETRPLWLALLNDYWLADADTYALAYRHLELRHCFKRIFLVSDQGAVSELESGA